MKRPAKSKPTKAEKPRHVSKIEILTVWFDYLKRSEGYKEFVAAVRDRGELPEFVTGTLTKFKKNYEQFGDIFAKGFSVKAIIDRFQFEEETFDEKQYLNLFNKTLENKPDREPTAKDLIKFLTQDLKRSSLLLLIIDIQGKTDEKLKAAFLDKVKERREVVEKEKVAYLKRMENRMGKKFVKDMRQTWEPPSISNKSRGIPFKRPSTSYFREGLEELKRYLRLFDEHIKTKKSIYHLAGNQRGEESRGPYLDFQKAKRIIENVESGTFPGKY